MKLKDKLFSRKNTALELFAPLNGTVIPLSGVEDEVFSKKILGDGFAVIPSENEICAPADGTIDTVFETSHAISMKTDVGIELLIHCGIDTVKLGGEGFSPCVKAGDRVKAGDMLMNFDAEYIKEKGYSVTTPVVVLNSDRFSVVSIATGDRHIGDKVIMLEEKKA